MADLANEKNGPSSDRNSEDADLVEIKDMLIKLGCNVEINLKDLEEIFYKNTPPESRFGLLQDVMFRIHPEKEFWVAKNETEFNSRILQVASWFGLGSEEIVLGGGTRNQQKDFWKLALGTAVQLQTPDNFTPINLDLARHLDFMVLNSNLLDEIVADIKGVDHSGENAVNVISKLIERIEGEMRSIQSQIDTERSTSCNKSSKTVSRKQELTSSMKAVHKNMSALLEKYKVLCPPPSSATTVDAASNDENKKLRQQMKDTLNSVVNVQTKLDKLMP